MEKWLRLRYLPNLPLTENGQRVTASDAHIALSKLAAREGMVLLKNEEKLLPFKKGKKLALFGKGTFDYVKGGGGSGDVTVDYTVNLYDGLLSCGWGIQIEQQTVDYYRDYVKTQYSCGHEPGMIAEPVLPGGLCAQARKFTDTAVISISRFSGEDWDRSIADDRRKQTGSGLEGKSAALFEKGDFYLSAAERAMVEKVKQYFPNIVVVLNVGGVVDTEWFFNDSHIQAVLMAWQGGMEGGKAAAELLCGIDSPCGKLSDTFAKSLEDYPSTAGFHESEDYVDYTEDIYVGYRYFETIPGAKSKVNYPFGYGLSYTSFAWHEIETRIVDGKICVTVSITNTGHSAGKEVLQLYVNAPQGKLGKASRVLVAFQKTRCLQPEESQIINLWVDLESMASYDDMGKVCKSAYVLEKGTYHFYLGTSVRENEMLKYVFELQDDMIVEKLTQKLKPTSLKKRMRADGTYEKLVITEPHDPNQTALEPMVHIQGQEVVSPAVRGIGRISEKQRAQMEKHSFYRVAEGTLTLEDFIAELSMEELVHLLGGQPNTGVANTCGFGNMPEYDVPNAMTADGPAGLRIRQECCICTTAFPCATLLACTWNPELTFCIGEAGAKEVKENNIAMWLTPAINIHRSPLCGRNFEYYSEDPYLAGVMAASMVKGIQSQHIAPAVKHFALNNKETNRRNSDSRVSERAAREIYLKVFEIVVKTANPWCIMSSYNIINGKRASENRELLEDILRGEWKFTGMVCSDWWTYGEHYKEVKAGNDLKMACGYPERLLAAAEIGAISRKDLEICAYRVLTLLLKLE